jgi:hypothetical protein
MYSFVQDIEHFLELGNTAHAATVMAIDLEGSNFGEEKTHISLLQVKFDNDPLAYVIDVQSVDSSIVFGSNSWFKHLLEHQAVRKFFFDGRKDVLIMKLIYGLNVTKAVDVQLLDVLMRGPENDIERLKGVFHMPYVRGSSDLFKYVVRLNSLNKSFEEWIADEKYILLDEQKSLSFKVSMNTNKSF